MKCPECRTLNPDTKKYCRECGSKLVVVCPVCGSETTPGDKFCGECGKDLIKPAEALTIKYSAPQSYTPKFLADKILTTRSSIEGERKLVTILFADVANYTAMSEALDPEEVHQIMDGCFSVLMDQIHKFEGTINQFTGDGVMALFGAPVAHEDHAQRACHAALSIQEAISDYGEKIKRDIGIDFSMRIGLNSGLVIVGSIGDDLRMDYTAIGDTTNLASRMENMAKSGTILVSEPTHRLVRDYFEFKSLGKVAVKGKEEPQEAFKLIKTAEVATRLEAAASKGFTPFVGRRNSMASLMEAYDKVKTGSGQVVGIVGEAGVGKSRILFEFRCRLPLDQFTYYEGRCLHYGASMPYIPILDILRSKFDIKDDDREFIVKKKIKDKINQLNMGLAETIPPIQDLLSLKVDDGDYIRLEPIQKKNKAFETIRNLLIQESQDSLVIVAIEDLHWIDRTSEEFLDYFLGWLPNVHILLILLYRPEYTHQWGSKSYYNRIGLDQLTTKSSAELVEAILTGGEVVPGLRELILSRAAGNPLFMEEITHTLIENGSIQKKDNRFVLTQKLSEIQVPNTIQGIIAARIDRLEDNLKRIMQVASVIGREFAFRVLQTIMGMREDLKSYLFILQGLEFIYEKSLFPELEYIFKHALTQEVAYNSLLEKRRKEIHGTIGRAIESLYAERLEEFYEMLAYHYSKSEYTIKAYHYLKLSGEKSMRNYSNWEAFRFYGEAIEVLNQLPENEDNKKKKIEVILLISIPMILLSYPENSLRILQEGERLCKEVKDEKGIAFLYSLIGMYYMHKGWSFEAIKYCELGYEKQQKFDDVELMTPIVRALCVSNLAVGQFRKPVDIAPGVIDLLEKTHRESDFFGAPFNQYTFICAYYGLSLAMLGNFEKSAAIFEKGLNVGTAINHFATLGGAEIMYGLSFVAKGDGANAVDHFQKCIKYYEDSKTLIIIGVAWSGLGCGYYYLGDLDAALKHMEKGLDLTVRGGSEWWVSFHYLNLSKIHLEIGNLDKSRKFIEEALRLSQKNSEKHLEGASWIWLGRILWKTDPSQCDQAEDHILKGIEILDGRDIKPWCSEGYLYQGELYVDSGKREKAYEFLKKAEKNFHDMGMNYWLDRAQGILERI